MSEKFKPKSVEELTLPDSVSTNPEDGDYKIPEMSPSEAPEETPVDNEPDRGEEKTENFAGESQESTGEEDGDSSAEKLGEQTLRALGALSAPEGENSATNGEDSHEKSVEDLTIAEASKEYLDLMLELSANFTSAEGRTSRAASYDEDGNLSYNEEARTAYSGEDTRVVGQLYGHATGKKFRTEMYNFRTDKSVEDEYLDREWAIHLCDNIVKAKSDRLAADESTTVEDEGSEMARLEREQQNAQDKLRKMGPITTFLYSKFNSRGYARLFDVAHGRPRTEAGKRADEADRRLRKSLEAAYSEDYGYGHHVLSYEHRRGEDKEYSNRVNVEYNDTFFSNDRLPKIHRAIELRRRLESEGVITERKY